MEDRIAFACTYLPDDEILVYLRYLLKENLKFGNIEGVFLTGLDSKNKACIEILQQYIDIHQDIQTVALLVCRNPNICSPFIEGSELDTFWLFEYRQLLNRWEMFMQRALLDVELGARYRSFQLKAKNQQGEQASDSLSTAAAPTATAMESNQDKSRNNIPEKMSSSSLAKSKLKPPSNINPTSSSNVVDRKTNTDRVIYCLPTHIADTPHVFLRCNFCASSLPVDCMQRQPNAAWLRRQRPIISCCPSCKKALPRCYICLLYLGMINPQVSFFFPFFFDNIYIYIYIYLYIYSIFDSNI